MKKIVIHTGFHPEVHREYRGEHIYKVVQTKTLGTDGKVVLDANGSVIPNAGANVFYKLDHTGWIKSVGPEMYVTDWCAEERWGCGDRRTGRPVERRDPGVHAPPGGPGKWRPLRAIEVKTK